MLQTDKKAGTKMKYSKEEILQYVLEDDVKFVRLAFCDVFGTQKNISIMADELPRAYEYGIAIDGSSVAGFGDEMYSDLLLFPESDTLMPLPWRPEHGKVVQMFCGIYHPDGTSFECDTRRLLKDAIAAAEELGCRFDFGAEQEFYLFLLDEKGHNSGVPYDYAGYMDIAPDDKGENIRREICLTLEQMGIAPESSHHEGGPGQNEIDFRYSDALSAADNAMTFQNVVKTIAGRNGLCADFGAKPLTGHPGNGFHINVSVKPDDDGSILDSMIEGLLCKARDMTLFLNPTVNSYMRLGENKAPAYVSWSRENRSQLIRVPAAIGEYRRAELRSPDPMANPYIAFTLVIYACLYGIENGLTLREATDINLYTADGFTLAAFDKLPETIAAAKAAATSSDFIKEHIPQEILDIYCK
jgi:glutamine synthetase